MAEPKLTPMQTKVLGELNKGLRPSAVAKKLKVTPSAIHGHIRRMKEAGVTLPEGIGAGQHAAVKPASTKTPPAIKVSTASNGVADPEQSLRAALQIGTDRVEAINGEVESLQARISELAAERATVISTGVRHEKALAAVLGDEPATENASSSFFATADAD
jgi:hypothetical protein